MIAMALLLGSIPLFGQSAEQHPEWPGKGQLFVGTCYQPVDRSREQIQMDIALMKQAGFTMVRMGDLSWDAFEPAEGQFEFAWFDQILEQMNQLGGVYVFPSPLDPKRPLSSMAMLEVLKRMGLQKQTTVHGVCRASFSTWANDSDAARPDVIEACLAHRETDIVRAAYNRAAFHAEREALLRAWADFCEGTEIAGKPKRRRKTASVIPFPKKDAKKTA